MTYTTKNPAALSTPNHNGCTIDRPVTQWPAFDQNHEYCGEIHRIAAWAVPNAVYEAWGLQDNLDLYLTTEGHWAPTLEIAEHLLASTPPPKSFKVKGSTLRFFFPSEWLKNKKPSINEDYRVFRDFANEWTAEVA